MLRDHRRHFFKLSQAIIEIRMYRNFFLMLGIACFTMYTVMFFNVENVSHIYLSMTWVYKSLLMISLITLLLLLFMSNVYKNKRINRVIILSSIFLFITALYGLRVQPIITDRQYIEAMIPQHSASIMISRQADIKNPKLRALADSIIHLQEERIIQMKAILNTLN